MDKNPLLNMYSTAGISVKTKEGSIFLNEVFKENLSIINSINSAATETKEKNSDVAPFINARKYSK